MCYNKYFEVIIPEGPLLDTKDEVEEFGRLLMLDDTSALGEASVLCKAAEMGDTSVVYVSSVCVEVSVMGEASM